MDGKKRTRSNREQNNPTYTNSANLPDNKRKKSFKNAANEVIRSRKPPDLASVVLQAMKKLKNKGQGVRFIKSLIDRDFKELKGQLDPNKPLVVIITTHGSSNNRQNARIFYRLFEVVKQIKRKGNHWLKWLKWLDITLRRESTATESHEREGTEATYVKANIDNEYQEFCPADAEIFQTNIAKWFRDGNDFSDQSVENISTYLHNLQFRDFPLNFIQSFKAGKLHLWKMANKRGGKWDVKKQVFKQSEPLIVDPDFDKVFSLSEEEILEYHWTDMLIHVVGRNGELIPFPRLFSDHAHLFGGAEIVEEDDRRSITYSRLLLLMSKFNRNLIFFDYTCGTGNRAENSTKHPFVPLASPVGGAPKTKKRKPKMSQKSKKTKGVSNKKGKSHKYARGHRHTRKN